MPWFLTDISKAAPDQGAASRVMELDGHVLRRQGTTLSRIGGYPSGPAADLDAYNNACRYGFRLLPSRVIKSFGDRDTERLFRREAVRRFPAELQRTMLRKLVLVDAAEALGDLRVPPGNRLEKLKGDRAGQQSIRVNDQWRICFRWHEGDAYDVALVDYH